MSVIDASGVRRPDGLPVAALFHAVLWVAVFLGGFVFYEPAPYELFLVLLIPLWLLTNPSIPRAVGPLIVLMVLFMTGGLLAAIQAKDAAEQPIYMAVTGFLALSSCFFAAVLGAEPERFGIVVGGWIAGALVSVGLGIIGYMGLSGELFTLYGRAAGGFEDPNVFGPFLVFPFAILAQRAMTRPLGEALWNGVLALVVMIGIFLSFSRAAWGLAAFAAVMVALLLLITARDPMARARYLGLAMAGATATVLVIALALTIPAVSELFQERAQIVQNYDSGHLGRFQRHAIGFNMMLDHPLGIGALEFGKIFGEDEHNIWLKALTSYGWLGFAAYLMLVVWTLVAAFPLLFRSSPIQSVTQVAYVVFLGHILIATVIDIDHWRHFFLLFGMLWGAIAADRLLSQGRLRAVRDGQPPTGLRLVSTA